MSEQQDAATVAATWGEHITDMQDLGDAGLVAIHRFLFTYAILSDITTWSYSGRWCYHSYEAAKTALDAWDGRDGTEPQGWHKDAATGRRRGPDGKDLQPWE